MFSFIDHVHENILDSFIPATACLRSWSPSCLQSTGLATRHNRRRPFFLKTFLPLALNATSLKEAAVALNKVSWWQALFLKGLPWQSSFVVFSLNMFANTFCRGQANLIYSENKCPESHFRGCYNHLCEFTPEFPWLGGVYHLLRLSTKCVNFFLEFPVANSGSLCTDQRTAMVKSDASCILLLVLPHQYFFPRTAVNGAWP